MGIIEKNIQLKDIEVSSQIKNIFTAQPPQVTEYDYMGKIWCELFELMFGRDQQYIKWESRFLERRPILLIISLVLFLEFIVTKELWPPAETLSGNEPEVKHQLENIAAPAVTKNSRNVINTIQSPSRARVSIAVLIVRAMYFYKITDDSLDREDR
ncbi:hypothetical protein BDF21DRAFT_401613 [Thamnidium elegans]|nr:hypothetical protein BDF21DRAFT_401613 [Thamnidium elegans]